MWATSTYLAPQISVAYSLSSEYQCSLRKGGQRRKASKTREEKFPPGLHDEKAPDDMAPSPV